MTGRVVHGVGGTARAAGAIVVAAAAAVGTGAIGGTSPAAAAARTPALTILSSPVALAHGELRFAPAAPSVRPRQRLGAVLATARAAAGKEAGPVRPRAYFGLFSASSPARKGPDGSTVPVFDRRPVWIIRYAGVKVRRASGVVERRVPPSTRTAPTTIDPVALIDIVVVIDDRDGRQILRSAYAAERVVGLDIVPTTTAVATSSTPTTTAAPASTVPVLELGPTSSAVRR